MKLKLKLNNNYNPSLILTLLFVLVVLIEAYFAYTHIYGNLAVSEDDINTTNIVRVNLTQYGEAIKVLDEFESHDAGVNLLEKNPFQ